LVVDYAQLIEPAGRDTELRTAAGRSSQILANIARRYDAPVLAISSVGRASYRVLRSDNRPDLDAVLRMAKESGQFEFDAACVLGICLLPIRDGNGDRLGWIAVGKSRYGGHIGQAAICFEGQRGTFRAVDPATIPETSVEAEDLVSVVVDAIRNADRLTKSKKEIRKWVHKDQNRVNKAIDLALQQGLLTQQGGYYIVPNDNDEKEGK